MKNKEYKNKKNVDKFCYVSIDVMKECIYENVIENIIPSNDLFIINKSRFIQDYIFMGFLLGNDLLPS